MNNFENIDIEATLQQMQDSIEQTHNDIAAPLIAKAEYEAAKDAAIFETRDILKKMQCDSSKDRKYLIIGTTASVIAAIGTVVSIIISFL